MTDEIWHRFEDRQVADWDPNNDECTGSHTEVQHLTYKVVRRTPKGVWLNVCALTQPRFVLLSAHKRFACPTVEEALESFVARKHKQAAIYRGRAARAECAIEWVQHLVRSEALCRAACSS